MKISLVLKLYRYKKAEIATTQARIEAYKNILKTNDFQLFSCLRSQEIGMPKSKYKISKPVEIEVLGKENQKQINADMLHEMINHEQSRIYPLQIETEQIEGALNALTYQDKQIIIWKYMDCLEWREVELSFYETYKKPLVEVTLKNRASEAINILSKLLKPFYDNFR